MIISHHSRCEGSRASAINPFDKAQAFVNVSSRTPLEGGRDKAKHARKLDFWPTLLQKKDARSMLVTRPASMLLIVVLQTSIATAERFQKVIDFESAPLGPNNGSFDGVEIFGSPQGPGNPTNDCRDIVAPADGRGVTSNGSATDCADRFGAFIVDPSQANRNGVLSLEFELPYLPDEVSFEVHQGQPGDGAGQGVEQVEVRAYDASGTLIETQTSLTGVAFHALFAAEIALVEIECNDGFTVDNVGFAGERPTQVTCNGFGPPAATGPVVVRHRRSLPLRVILQDDSGTDLTDTTLVARPVLQVTYNDGSGDQPIDVTSQALAPGRASHGNQFRFDADGYWWHNLRNRSYTAAGSYTVSLTSGDSSAYVIDPACAVELVVD